MKNYFNFSYKYCTIALFISLLTFFFFTFCFSSATPPTTYFFFSWAKYIQEGMAPVVLSKMALPVAKNILTWVSSVKGNSETVLRWLSCGVFCLSSIFLYATFRLLKGHKTAYMAIVVLYSSLGSIWVGSHLLDLSLTFLGQQVVIFGFTYTLKHPKYGRFNILLPLIYIFFDTGNSLLGLFFLSATLRFSANNLPRMPLNTALMGVGVLGLASLGAAHYAPYTLVGDLGYRISHLFSNFQVAAYMNQMGVTLLLGLFPWNGFAGALVKKPREWEDIFTRNWMIISCLLVPLNGFCSEFQGLFALNVQCLAPYSLLIGNFILSNQGAKKSLLGVGAVFLLGLTLECFLLEYAIKLPECLRFLPLFIGLFVTSVTGLFSAFTNSLRHKFTTSLILIFVTTQICVGILAKMMPLFIDQTNQKFSTILLKYLKTEDDIVFYPHVELYGIPYYTEHSVKFLDNRSNWPFYSHPETWENLKNNWASGKTVFLVIPKETYLKDVQNTSLISPFFILDHSSSYVLGTNRSIES